MTAPDLRVRDPRVRKAERIGSELARAAIRLDQERKSGCASPEDLAFWRSEVYRLEQEFKGALK